MILKDIFMGLIGVKKVLVFIALVLFSAKTIAQNPLMVESADLYKHSTNSSDVVGPVAGELTDTVTTGSLMRYYIIPSALNTLYTLTPAGVLSGSLSSSFNWSLTGAIGTAAGTIDAVTTPTDYSAFSNYKIVTWAGIGTINLNVQEQSSAGCLSSNTTTTPVAVIAVPTVQFSSTSSGVCTTGADGAVGYSLTGLPVTWTSTLTGLRNLQVNISVSCTNSSYGLPKTYNNVVVSETVPGSGTFNMPVNLDHFGLYTITLTAINDRISKKCGTDGTVGVSAVYSFTLGLTPTSGPVFHNANQ
jgi:hypothetical protein